MGGAVHGDSPVLCPSGIDGGEDTTGGSGVSKVQLMGAGLFWVQGFVGWGGVWFWVLVGGRASGGCDVGIGLGVGWKGGCGVGGLERPLQFGQQQVRLFLAAEGG